MSLTRSNHTKQVLRILFFILIANIGVALLKIIVGSMIRSSAMTADGIHSLSDGASNIVGILGVFLAARPEDKSHPYGHAKIETLAGMVVGLLLIVAGIKVLAGAINQFIAPEAITISPASLIIMVITLLINILVTVYEKRMGKRYGDEFLVADAIHTKSDIYVTVGVLIALIAMRLGLPPIIDPLVSLVVVFFIFRAARQVLFANGNVLLDASTVDPEKVRACVSSFHGVTCVHEVRSRGTSTHPYIEMHIEVDPEMTVVNCHSLTHAIEDRIRRELAPNAQVLVHVEPLGDSIEGAKPDDLPNR